MAHAGYETGNETRTQGKDGSNKPQSVLFSERKMKEGNSAVVAIFNLSRYQGNQNTVFFNQLRHLEVAW